MKYSNRDLLLFSLSLIQFFSLILWARFFGHLNIPVNCFFFLIELVLFYYNPIVITHNFLHTPFFSSENLNQIFPIFNSMNLGLPQILYKYHHLNHHRHNNSLQDPSSTYLFGKNGKQEHWISYGAFSLFREGTTIAYKQVLQKNEYHLFVFELVAVITFWIFLVALNFKFFLVIYLPLFYAGWFLAHIENYYEHFKARSPENRFGNAVSVYHDWYNLLMFNEGYHQEHHISPQEHWSKRPQTRIRFEKKMEEAGAYRASLPPLLGMFE